MSPLQVDVCHLENCLVRDGSLFPLPPGAVASPPSCTVLARACCHRLRVHMGVSPGVWNALFPWCHRPRWLLGVTVLPLPPSSLSPEKKGLMKISLLELMAVLGTGFLYVALAVLEVTM